MAKGPFGLPRLTSIGPFTESVPNRILVNQQLEVKLSMLADQVEYQDKSLMLDDTYNLGRPGAELSRTLNSEEQIDDRDYLSTTLLLSCEQKNTDNWPTAFHRLVMPDTEMLREGMESLASKRVRFNTAPLGGAGVGDVAFGQSHFENPGDYIAAHWAVGEFESHSEFLETCEAMTTLFEEAVKIEKRDDNFGISWYENNA